jgi:hypothetical protein
MKKFEEYAKKLNIPSPSYIANLVYTIKQNNDTEIDNIIYKMYKEAFEAGQQIGKDWIPVTTEPKEDTPILVRIKSNKIEQMLLISAIYKDKHFIGFDGNIYSDVIAWQPLPEE